MPAFVEEIGKGATSRACSSTSRFSSRKSVLLKGDVGNEIRNLSLARLKIRHPGRSTGVTRNLDAHFRTLVWASRYICEVWRESGVPPDGAGDNLMNPEDPAGEGDFLASRAAAFSWSSFFDRWSDTPDGFRKPGSEWAVCADRDGLCARRPDFRLPAGGKVRVKRWSPPPDLRCLVIVDASGDARAAGDSLDQTQHERPFRSLHGKLRPHTTASAVSQRLATGRWREAKSSFFVSTI